MALSESFLLEATKTNIWLALRTDQIRGDGSAQNPYNGSLSFGPEIPVKLPAVPTSIEIDADTGGRPHGFVEGDMVQINGVTGTSLTTAQWNRAFCIYDVTANSFKFGMGFLPNAPAGMPTVSLVTFNFDNVLRDLSSNIRVNLGPGVFQTRGYAPNGFGRWHPKAGQKIVGAGLDVSTLRLVGAGVVKVGSDLVEQHYHAVGMPISPTGTNPAGPADGFEISDLTIDCGLNVVNISPDPSQPQLADVQQLRGTDQYPKVACGAVRVFGSHCHIRRVKAINWGTKTLKEGCFVMSIIDASAETTDGSGQPVAQETTASGVEDCVATQPSKNCVRETTVLHLGGKKNPTNQAQAFGAAPFIRRNFVDCGFTTAAPSSQPFGSHFLTGTIGTRITDEFTPDGYPVVGIFVCKRPHLRSIGEWIRFYNLRDAASRWNGYVPVISTDPDRLYLDLATSQGTTDDSSFVIMGAKIRGIAVTSCQGAVVEQNQIHNCWIGGPYSSPMDDSVSQPTTPPTLAREERLDPLNALNTRSLIVRNNFYKDVAVGPYWNMGGVSAAVLNNSISYDFSTGLVTVTTAKNHKLWLGARVKIGSTPNPAYDGVREVSHIIDGNTFKYALAARLSGMASGSTASYQVVSGVDYLTIEGNVIELAGLDETEFGIKEYPLAASAAAQTYRAFGIVVADNGLSALAGPYVHRQVFIRNNKIRYVDALAEAVVPGLGRPAGAAMQLAGIKQLHVTHNVVDLNAPEKLRTFRIGAARFFHNTHPEGGIVASRHDEPETLIEDAFILSMLTRRRR